MSSGKKNKQKGDKKKKSPKFTRKTADRHALYQLSVQDADFEQKFISKTFKRAAGRPALSLREDFCGTALFCAAWVASGRERVAVGIDLDPEVLTWGRQHNIAPLGSAGDRVTLLEQDVLAPVAQTFDACVAFNFSYWCFRERAQLRAYFEGVRRSLAPDGMFFLDAYGGYESHEPDLEEPRKIDAGFTYVWHQDKVCPISGTVLNHIHFEFKDKTKWRNAFTYEWRFWSLPEIREVLEEAGFEDVTVYWDVAEDEAGSAYKPRKTAANVAGWIAYISARPKA